MKGYGSSLLLCHEEGVGYNKEEVSKLKRLTMIIIIIGIGLAGAVMLYIWAVPRLLVEMGLSSIQTLDYEKYGVEIMPEAQDYEKEILETVLTTMTYEIVGYTYEVDQVIASVNIENVDLFQLVERNKGNLLKYSVINFKETVSDLFSGGLQKVSLKKLLMLLNDEAVSKTRSHAQVEIVLKREGLTFHPVISESVIKAIVGLPQSFDISDSIEHLN